MNNNMAVAKKSTESNRVSGKSSTQASGRKTSGRQGTAKRKTAAGKNKTNAATRRENLETINAYKDHQAFETGITIAVVAIVSLLLYLSYFSLAGKAGKVIGGLMFGIFGWAAWFLPLFVLVGYVFMQVNAGDKRAVRKISSGAGILLSLLALTDLIFNQDTIYEYYKINHVTHKGYFDAMYLSCNNVMEWGRGNGGLIGKAVGAVFSFILGRAGGSIILFAVLFFCIYIFYGMELMAKLRKRNAYQQEMNEIYEQVKEDKDYREPSYRLLTFRENEKNRRKKPMREMKKVPKVQSFDLMGQAAFFKDEEKEPDEEKHLIHTESEEEDRKDKQEREEKKGHKDNKTQKEEKEKSEEFSSVEKEEKQGSFKEDFPIYRNELEEKFRHPKEENLVTPKTVVREEEFFGNRESAFDRFERRKEEMQLEKEAVRATQGGEESTEEIREEAGQEGENPFQLEEVLEAGNPEEETVGEGFSVAAVPVAEETVSESSLSGMVGKNTAEYIDAGKEEETPEEKVPEQEEAPGTSSFVQKKEEAVIKEEEQKVSEKPYEFPPIDLLSRPKSGMGMTSDEELRKTAVKLQETLESFNVKVKMGAVTCGPTVTRYELLPEHGVRVNKITNLADDLKLSLAAPNIRIEAPIPGKAAVGIEVPNAEASPVSFRELLEGEQFAQAKSDLTFAVGKDIAGKLIMADIAKMPHLLIAGATGSGKSVCINTLIMSILYKADPKDVKLIMIDPKVVELSCYNGIPHLFCPVVTDPKEAAASLNWAVREMMDRYNKFKELNVRNIAGYNEKIKTVEDAEKAGYEKMPYLVVIVDEFADLMMVASKEVEDAVCRLAQLARAAGIHLVLATQRPSVNVITGVIKANIPSRIAFSVSSTIDSRTILDKGGAEKLLGKGDMLFFPSGYSEPVRVQGAFVSDKEVNDVVDFLCNTNETPEYNHAVTEIIEPEQEEAVPEKKAQSDRDEYFEDAGRFVIESERAAAGQLQRHFSIGFNRAGRIIDQLEKAGVVGPAAGTKPRTVLMTIEEFEQMLHGGSASLEREPMDEGLLSETADRIVNEYHKKWKEGQEDVSRDFAHKCFFADR